MLLRFFNEESQLIGESTIKGYWENPLKPGEEHQIGDCTYTIVTVLEIAFDGNFMFLPVLVVPKSEPA